MKDAASLGDVFLKGEKKSSWTRAPSAGLYIATTIPHYFYCFYLKIDFKLNNNLKIVSLSISYHSCVNGLEFDQDFLPSEGKWHWSKLRCRYDEKTAFLFKTHCWKLSWKLTVNLWWRIFRTWISSRSEVLTKLPFGVLAEIDKIK